MDLRFTRRHWTAPPMPGGLYSEFHHDKGQAEQLGVQATPSLFLLNPPRKVLQLSQGILSLDDLTNRILTVAHSEGLITDHFNLTDDRRITL